MEDSTTNNLTLLLNAIHFHFCLFLFFSAFHLPLFSTHPPNHHHRKCGLEMQKKKIKLNKLPLKRALDV